MRNLKWHGETSISTREEQGTKMIGAKQDVGANRFKTYWKQNLIYLLEDY